MSAGTVSSGRVDLTTLREKAQAAVGPQISEISFVDGVPGMTVDYFEPPSLAQREAYRDFTAFVSPDVVLALVEAVETLRYVRGQVRAILVGSGLEMSPEARDEFVAAWDESDAALVPFAAAEEEGTT